MIMFLAIAGLALFWNSWYNTASNFNCYQTRLRFCAQETLCKVSIDSSVWLLLRSETCLQGFLFVMPNLETIARPSKNVFVAMFYLFACRRWWNLPFQNTGAKHCIRSHYWEGRRNDCSAAKGHKYKGQNVQGQWLLSRYAYHQVVVNVLGIFLDVYRGNQYCWNAFMENQT